jgi:guanylate kinase
MAGTLIIITAPSGTGKTTLVRALCESNPDLQVSISCTTRAKRPGEQEGADYYFVDDKTFDKMVANHEFLEYKHVFDNRYGTPRLWVEQQLQAGKDVILEIDWQGAREMRTLMPDKIISIFILPPTFATLEERLRGRGQDLESTVRRRMREALDELSHYNEFDYLVINDDLKSTQAEVEAIIEARHRGEPYVAPDRHEFAAGLMAENGKIK